MQHVNLGLKRFNNLLQYGCWASIGDDHFEALKTVARQMKLRETIQQFTDFIGTVKSRYDERVKQTKRFLQG